MDTYEPTKSDDEHTRAFIRALDYEDDRTFEEDLGLRNPPYLRLIRSRKWIAIMCWLMAVGLAIFPAYCVWYVVSIRDPENFDLVGILTLLFLLVQFGLGCTGWIWLGRLWYRLRFTFIND